MPRRPGRPEIRAAVALENAGELQEAARIFEYAGEHAQAAALRLEYARTLGSAAHRLAVLREGAARSPEDAPESRALHLALAQAVLTEADALDDGARRRNLQVEAASALESADEGTRAGQIYEALGMLSHAARAYEKAGAVTELELVLEVMERAAEAKEALRRLEREVDEAQRDGQRRRAHALLRAHVDALARLGRAPRPAMADRLRRLESSLPTRARIDLKASPGGAVRVVGSATLRVGRSPDVGMTVSRPSLSREHVELSLGPNPYTEDRGSVLLATDLGSRSGSFWDGDAMEPGDPVPLLATADLGLGMAAALQVTPVGESGSQAVCGALVEDPSGGARVLFLPQGGPLRVASQTPALPARLHFDDGYVILDADEGVNVWLDGRPLGDGARVELAKRDRLRLVAQDLDVELEVLP